mmetsp:Transcript_10817/g.22890  ORF Transcript_10817/g.22890 Transcript_10817/m.22890 type:complete len:223 (+) Transcript_10817:568-1236(+)
MRMCPSKKGAAPGSICQHRCSAWARLPIWNEDRTYRRPIRVKCRGKRSNGAKKKRLNGQIQPSRAKRPAAGGRQKGIQIERIAQQVSPVHTRICPSHLLPALVYMATTSIMSIPTYQSNRFTWTRIMVYTSYHTHRTIRMTLAHPAAFPSLTTSTTRRKPKDATSTPSSVERTVPFRGPSSPSSPYWVPVWRSSSFYFFALASPKSEKTSVSNTTTLVPRSC